MEYLTVILRDSWTIQSQTTVQRLYQLLWARAKYFFYTQFDEEITVVAAEN
jgi:hypothetical protein